MPPIQISVPADSYVIVLAPLDVGLLWIVFVIAVVACYLEWNAIFDPKKKEGKQ